jgi:hypothetical protein
MLGPFAQLSRPVAAAAWWVALAARSAVARSALLFAYVSVWAAMEL